MSDKNTLDEKNSKFESECNWCLITKKKKLNILQLL